MILAPTVPTKTVLKRRAAIHTFHAASRPRCGGATPHCFYDTKFVKDFFFIVPPLPTQSPHLLVILSFCFQMPLPSACSSTTTEVLVASVTYSSTIRGPKASTVPAFRDTEYCKPPKTGPSGSAIWTTGCARNLARPRFVTSRHPAMTGNSDCNVLR